MLANKVHLVCRARLRARADLFGAKMRFRHCTRIVVLTVGLTARLITQICDM